MRGDALILWMRSLLRYAYGAAFILALSRAGYLWNDPESRTTVFLLLALAFAAIAVFEALAWSLEDEAARYHALVNQDEEEFAAFKERVRMLGGVVNILWQDNAELRQGHLIGEIDPSKHPVPAPIPHPPEAIDDAAAKLLALPEPESSSPATSSPTEEKPA